jgi:uncharacterized protein (TIGR02284 family)
MEQHKKTAEILNDLVLINNDRMEGYAKAIEETKPEDSDLKLVFEQMKIESFQNRRELISLVDMLGEEKAEGTRLDGKIYRAWMDIKATFSGNSRKSILENCEFGEDAAQKAYRSALSSIEDLTPNALSVISQQQVALKGSHDKIKQLRDSIY